MPKVVAGGRLERMGEQEDLRFTEELAREVQRSGAAPYRACIRSRSSEDILQCELDDSGIGCTCDLAEGVTGDGRIWI